MQKQIAQLEKRLFIDELTGCYTRQFFFPEFEKKAKQGDALFFLDIDDFKSVNDHYGHTAGDELLGQIGTAMMEAVGDQGFVARMSGDEFLIYLDQPEDGTLNLHCDRILRAVSGASIRIRDMDVARHTSIGAVIVRQGMNGKEAAHAADKALLKAKSSGKNRARISSDRSASFSPFLPSPDEVRLGLQRNEIGYHLQPIFDCENLAVVGYEALLRWVRPSGEILGSSQFLDTMTSAYDHRTKPPLAAAQHVAYWATVKRNKFISFNISTAFLEQVASSGLDWVTQIVGNAPSDQIVFELVETSVNRQADNISRVVAKLRASGIRVAMDDFGVGHSTLERLQEHEVDIVKIDRRFLTSATGSNRDRDILRGMIEITHNTGAKSVVEGVETAEELQLVRDLGAHMAQGFFLGVPAPISDLEISLKQ